MIELQASVNKTVLTINDVPKIASGSKNYVSVRFQFDSEWSSIQPVMVCYRDIKAPFYNEIIGGTAKIPHEVLRDPGPICIGVFGISGSTRITSTVYRIIIQQGTVSQNIQQSDPSNDIWSQIMNQYQEIKDLCKNIIATSEEAAKKAQGFADNASYSATVASQQQQMASKHASTASEAATKCEEGVQNALTAAVTAQNAKDAAQSASNTAKSSSTSAKAYAERAERATTGIETALSQANAAAQNAQEAKSAAQAASQEATKAADGAEAAKKAALTAQAEVNNGIADAMAAANKAEQAVGNIGPSVQQAQDAAKSASDSAKAAALSKQGIETAEASAKESAKQAAASKTAAEQSYTQASEAASRAQQAQTAAAKSATDADESAKLAHESQTNAEIYASKATEQATAAEDSAKRAEMFADEIKGQANSYSDMFFKNFFAMQKTGRKYTVRFPLWETSRVPTGEKLDNNIGLRVEPSTMTERGIDDYANIPLFKTYDCNVEKVDGKLKITAMRGDANFDPYEKDTFVLGMPYYEKAWIADGYQYLSRSDSPLPGYHICPEAKMANGKIRSFCLYAKYVAGENSAGVLGSFADKAPKRNMSYNNNVDFGKARGSEYAFGSSYDIAYIQNTFLIKYATKDWNKALGGCFSYSRQYIVSSVEENVNRVVLKKAEAEQFVIGSSVSVGDIGDGGNKDRGQAAVHNICDSVEIIDIVEVDAENKALILGIDSPITTTATTLVSSMHWRSGYSSRILGRDGAPCKVRSEIASIRFPSVIQGIELIVGGYEVLGNAFMDIVDPNTRDVYICDDSSKLTRNIADAKSHYVKSDTQMRTSKSAVWAYITKIAFDENGINIVTEAGDEGSGTATGYCDGYYTDAAATGQRQFLCFGFLGHGSSSGSFCVNGSAALSAAWWHLLARLSVNVYRGEFA